MSKKKSAVKPLLPAVPLLGPGALVVVCLCFFLSGCAALVYQIAWTREFAIVFGTSEIAVATVLAAYMGGLALGAMLAEKLLPRVACPIRIYAALELAIAVAAVALVPAAIWLADRLLVATLGSQTLPPSADQAGSTLFYLASAFVALAIPTMLMGATLPILARHVVRAEQQIGARVGMLYTCNTVGAVVGALLASLALLPELGLRGTIWLGAALNVLVSLIALVLASRHEDSSVAPDPDRSKDATPSLRFAFSSSPSPAWVLPLMCFSGAVSFLHEVLWTRILGHVLGSSIYAFGVMLASFLAGIAIGGAAGGLLARSQSAAARWLSLSQLASAAAAVAAWYAVERWAPLAGGLNARIVFGLVVLLPLSISIGLTYPLAVRVLAVRAEDAAPASARVYAWNTVGAIVGALGGGFLLLPALRFEGSVRLAVIASTVIALLAGIALARPQRIFLGTVAALALAAAVLFQPQRPDRLLQISPLSSGIFGDLVYYDVGRSASVAVARRNGRLLLRTNGLPEASIEARGAGLPLNGESWMSALAVLARPAAADMLIVGFGSGRVIEATPASVRSIDVVELEPKVIEANRAVSPMRARDPLTDARVNLILNDARGALALTSRRYDAIISQPSHPWTAGASHLYTREFMQQVRGHLTQDGIFVQWMNASLLNEELLRSLLATLIDVFGEVRLYRPDPDTLLFAASAAPIEPERLAAASDSRLLREPAHFAPLGIHSAEDLAAALALDSGGVSGFAAGARLITDNRNLFATASIENLGRGMTREALGRALAPYDPLRRADSEVFQLPGRQLRFDAIGRRLASFALADPSVAGRIEGMATALRTGEQAAFLRALAVTLDGHPDAGQRMLRESLADYPDSDLLRFESIKPWLGALAVGKAPPEVAALAAKLSEEPAQIIAAARYGAQDRWDVVAALDAGFTHVAWTAPWMQESAQLRSEWRVRAQNTELRPQRCDEVVAIIDPVVMLFPNVTMDVLRAWSAVGADRPAVLVESVSGLAQATLESAAQLGAGHRQYLQSNLAGLLHELEVLDLDQRVDKDRLREVRDQVRSAMVRLSTSVP